ncbi:hypothetical protein D3C87_1774110 [compost metagenome]
MQQQQLRTAHGECGDDDRAAARDRAADDVRQGVQHVLCAVQPVAVGGFNDQVIGFGDRLGRRHQRIVVAAQVARKHQLAAVVGDVHHRRAQDVARARQGKAQPGRQVLGGDEFNRAQGGNGPLRVGNGVQR